MNKMFICLYIITTILITLQPRLPIQLKSYIQLPFSECSSYFFLLTPVVIVVIVFVAFMNTSGMSSLENFLLWLTLVCKDISNGSDKVCLFFICRNTKLPHSLVLYFRLKWLKIICA